MYEKNTNRSDRAFIYAVIVSIVFLFLPAILRISGLKGIISGYLAPPGELKASYIETCGIIFGYHKHRMAAK